MVFVVQASEPSGGMATTTTTAAGVHHAPRGHPLGRVGHDAALSAVAETRIIRWKQRACQTSVSPYRVGWV